MNESEIDKIAKKIAAEIKALERKTAPAKKTLEEAGKEKKAAEKEKKAGSEEAKKKLIDLDKAAKAAIKKIEKEASSASGRLKTLLENDFYSKNPDAKAVKDTQKKVDGRISGKGLKIGDKLWLKPDLQIKNKRFDLNVTGEF